MPNPHPQPLIAHAPPSRDLFLPYTSSQRSISARLSIPNPLHSPPPSPALPSAIPRHGGKLSPRWLRRLRRLLRLVFYICVIAATVTLAFRKFLAPGASRNRLHQHSEDRYHLVMSDTWPQRPAAVILKDAKGRRRWTIRIPPAYDFPLRPEAYKELCREASAVSKLLQGGRKQDTTDTLTLVGKRGSMQKGDAFMDVAEAKQHGLIPEPGPAVRQKNGPVLFKDGYTSEYRFELSEADLRLCDRSLTFVMESSDAGLGSTLMGLWLAYGLAVRDDRAFFIDDTRWPYGTYSSYFARAHEPSCISPPRTHILPYPAQARHLLVSRATLPYLFGLSGLFQKALQPNLKQQKALFDLLRTGYEALFELVSDDAAYVKSRVEHLRSRHDVTVGVHIRRGDCRPGEKQYSRDYLPLDRYLQAAEQIIANLTARFYPSRASFSNRAAAGMVVASDDPDIYTAPELSHVARAQDRIVLASGAALDRAFPSEDDEPKEAIYKHVAGNLGWDGGFFRDVFWSLVQTSRSTANIKGNVKIEKEASQAATRVIEFVGRSYLMDLAVLGNMDGVVCGVRAMGCRILALMLGWEKALVEGAWKNIDGIDGWDGFWWR